jgi:hypothetical protein
MLPYPITMKIRTRSAPECFCFRECSFGLRLILQLLASLASQVVKPPDFDPSRRYPLLLEIHGAPYGMYNVGFNPSFQNFAGNGYILLHINTCGSTGYGNASTNIIAKHYPGPEYDDLMAGVDAVIKQGSVDESHLFVSGCSDGVLSSWVIGPRAAIEGNMPSTIRSY